MSKSAPKHSIVIYIRLLSYVKPYKWWFFLSFFGYIIFACSSPLYAKLVEYFLEALKNNTQFFASIPFYGQISSMKLTIFVPIAVIMVAFLSGIGAFMGAYFLAKVSRNIVNILRCELFDRLLTLPMQYFDHQISSHLVTKITYNSEQITISVCEAVQGVIREGLSIIFILVYLFYIEWVLALFFLLFVPFLTITVKYVGIRFRKMSHYVQDSVGDLTHVTSETIKNYRVVRGFNGQQCEKKRFVKACNYNLSKSLKISKLESISAPVLRFVLMFLLACIMYCVFFFAKYGFISASAAQLVSFLIAAGMLPKSVRQLSIIHEKIQKGIAAAESMFDFLDESSEKDEGVLKVDQLVGDLEFRNVCFSYKKNINILHEINFTIPSKQVVAIIGRSGCGKTTLANLISRYYDVDSGQILIDGVDVQRYSLDNLRSHIAEVSQSVYLFSDTIKNNIAYGVAKEKMINDDIYQAAKKAYAVEFIEKLPQGFDTVIGENGFKLSGGQRQRIALARAIFKKASILILDEATSALDIEAENFIQDALKSEFVNHTTLIIAHRLATTEIADKILVMDSGTIIEEGRHDELLEQRGTYYDMYCKFRNEEKK